MRTPSRLLAAATLVVALALLSACPACDAFAAADCCACLIRHKPDGSQAGGPDIAQDNCLPPADSADAQGNLCGNSLGRQVGGDPNAPEAVEVTSLACVETHCADVCGPMQEKGGVFRLFAP